jgi:hypothetical protein
MARLIKIHEDGRQEVKEQGSRIDAIAWNDDGTFKEVAGHLPITGCSLLVGSISARSYSDQDYWLTSKVTEVLEEKKDDDGRFYYVRFRTKNSEYVLEA